MKFTKTINTKSFKNLKINQNSDISLTKKGTYTATVNFVGDSSYATSSKTVKITLK